jgi:hypothetical protein
MEKQYFGNNFVKKISFIEKVRILLLLLISVCAACQKSVGRCCHPFSDTVCIEQSNMRIITCVTSDGDTCKYHVNDNNRLLYIGGYLSDLDRIDTIFYEFFDNRLIGFHFASGMKSDESDSLEIINSINSQYKEYLWLKRKGIRFFSPDIDHEKIHDIYTILSDNKEDVHMKAGNLRTFEIHASYGCGSFGAIINGFLNIDSRLRKLQLCVDKKNRIVQEIYYFNDTKISRIYDYNPNGYLVRVYQDGELFYGESYKITQ